MYCLKLFIAYPSDDSLQATQALRSALRHKCKADFSFEVISVLERPEQAEKDRILATPTILRTSPGPEIRLIGSMRDMEKVLRKLGLKNGNGNG
jgi:circadian clock protein KaiB